MVEEESRRMNLSSRDEYAIFMIYCADGGGYRVVLGSACDAVMSLMNALLSSHKDAVNETLPASWSAKLRNPGIIYFTLLSVLM